MHDLQSPDDPDLDGINENFDFGEQVQLDPVQTTQRHRLNKSVLLGLSLLLLGALVGVGIRFIKIPQAPVAPPHALAAVPHSPTAPHHSPATVPHALELEKAFAQTDNVTPEAQQALFAAPPVAPPSMHATQGQSPSLELIPKLQDALKTLNQQIDTMLTKINYLDGYSQEMSQHLERLHESINSMDQRLSNAQAMMDQRLSTLSHTTSTLSQDVGGVKRDVSQVQESLKDEGLDRPPVLRSNQQEAMNAQQPIDIENPEYQVHAVIPGRAWLKSTKGTITTVAEGDSLGNYGKVLVIDAAHGLVLTSSGVTFR